MRGLDRVAPACSFHLIDRLFDEAPSQKQSQLFAQVYVDLGLKRESVHDERVGSIEIAAAVTNRQPGRVFDEAVEPDVFLEKSVEVSAERRGAPAEFWD